MANHNYEKCYERAEQRCLTHGSGRPWIVASNDTSRIRGSNSQGGIDTYKAFSGTIYCGSSSRRLENNYRSRENAGKRRPAYRRRMKERKS